MKIRIILSGTGGELDRLTMDWDEMSDSELSRDIHDELKVWTLAPGDTIKIVEVE